MGDENFDEMVAPAAAAAAARRKLILALFCFRKLKDEGATLQEEISSAIKGLQRLGEHRNSYSLIV
jgi:hypothetical protein